MSKFPRVLVIPSWYPTEKHPLVGGFFRDQATLLKKRFDVRVLYGARVAPGRYSWIMKNGLSRTSSLEIKTTPDKLTEYHFEYISWLRDEKSIFNSTIECYRQMVKSIIKSGWKPDVIHAQCTDAAGVVASKIAEELGIPWVLTEHQVFALGNYSAYRQKLIRKAVLSATTIAVVSQHQLRCMVIHRFNRPMVVVGNLIDEEIFRFTQPVKEKHLFRILTVMYPSMFKDPETFFQAIAILLRKGHNDIEVVVIGESLSSDVESKVFRQLSDKYNVQHVCQFIPKVSHSEMPQYFANCDVFVSTSIAETFGIAVREAMAVGRPVVCTASGGVDDDIFEFNGFKVDIYDYKGIANKLIAIKTGIVKYNPKKIQEFVISNLGQQAFLTKMSAIYEGAITSGKNHAA
jgi:glycosyltransferase involved in cell wall biosynthesis